MKPLHDYILISPYKEEHRIITPSEPDKLITKGTVMEVGPFVNDAPFFFDNTDGIDRLIKDNEKAIAAVEKADRDNTIRLGDIVYFPTSRSYKLGTNKDPIYAVKSFDLIAVERLEDIE